MIRAILENFYWIKIAFFAETTLSGPLFLSAIFCGSVLFGAMSAGNEEAKA
ncbi:hypothetical protein [Alistipes timonensis]|uniref:hypothetical protein n=1 Tax=Alistipes timonensis TaxID=1465754 RepID=UPI001C3D4279|nr:hypothetical protein [Alistipes timonensis]MCR2031115.1 hypothetical protein [Alistipes timonensis]